MVAGERQTSAHARGLRHARDDGALGRGTGHARQAPDDPERAHARRANRRRRSRRRAGRRSRRASPHGRPPPIATPPPSSSIENAAIGEHEIRLTKTCYADETLHEIVSADLADRSPKVLRVAVMRPARTRVNATGATYEGELRVDGERVASMPLTSFSMCPGDRKIEVVTSGRVVWSGRIAAEEADVTLDLTPRPTVSASSGRSCRRRGPRSKRVSASDARLPVPAGVDLATSDGWRGMALPPGTDLALARDPEPGRGERRARRDVQPCAPSGRSARLTAGDRASRRGAARRSGASSSTTRPEP